MVDAAPAFNLTGNGNIDSNVEFVKKYVFHWQEEKLPVY